MLAIAAALLLSACGSGGADGAIVESPFYVLDSNPAHTATATADVNSSEPVITNVDASPAGVVSSSCSSIRPSIEEAL